MINFKIEPKSAHSNSYTDIKFTVNFDNCNSAEIRIFNTTVSEQLNIIATNTGYIQSGNIVIVKDANKVTGYFNLFNNDKMNNKLEHYVSVNLECEVVRVIGDTTVKERETTEFYNQSMSIDGNIIPFDFSLENNNIDLYNNEPMRFNILCNISKRFEFCVRSDQVKNNCTFEIVTRNGLTNIELPSEILWHDLNLSSFSEKRIPKFNIYWVKFEGVTYEKFMNRKYIFIPNTEISFNTNQMFPRETSRIGPLGTEIQKPDFVVSHRYLVLTHRNYSQYGGYLDKYTPWRLRRMTLFMNEAQDIEKSIISEKNITPKLTQRAIIDDFRKMANKRTEKDFISVFSTSTKSQKELGQKSRTIVPKQHKEKGCGCSRKK